MNIQNNNISIKITTLLKEAFNSMEQYNKTNYNSTSIYTFLNPIKTELLKAIAISGNQEINLQFLINFTESLKSIEQNLTPVLKKNQSYVSKSFVEKLVDQRKSHKNFAKYL
ncbi:MAG: hypothetical protein AB8U25_07525 [Rickettsiales endosymbiont of Dermacentor nuttalli]